MHVYFPPVLASAKYCCWVQVHTVLINVTSASVEERSLLQSYPEVVLKDGCIAPPQRTPSEDCNGPVSAVVGYRRYRIRGTPQSCQQSPTHARGWIDCQAIP